MTITDLFTFVDSMRPNAVPQDVKLRFLNDLEGRAYMMIGPSPDPHRMSGRSPGPFFHELLPIHVYTEEDLITSAELSIPDPFSEVYRWYLAAMIDVYDGQTELYANDSALYNEAWDRYAKWYVREGVGRFERRCRR